MFVRSMVMDQTAEALGTGAWPAMLREQVLGLQYTARRRSLRDSFPDPASLVVDMDDSVIGWMVLAESPDEIRLADWLLRQDCRGRGIGTRILNGVLERARSVGKPVRLHVEVSNVAAVRLYLRMGFERVSGDGVRDFFEANPARSRL